MNVFTAASSVFEHGKQCLAEVRRDLIHQARSNPNKQVLPHDIDPLHLHIEACSEFVTALEYVIEGEPSTIAIKNAVITACSDLEIIPNGPPVGDHRATDNAEAAVRQAKGQPRSL